MKNKIISGLVLSIFAISTLSGCSEETRVSENSRNIDTNTGTWSDTVYAADIDQGSDVIRGASSDDIAVKPAPNNDEQLMENPSAVANANNNANRRINSDIKTPVYVNAQEGYVDRPNSGETVAGNDNQIQVAANNQNSDTFENKEEGKGINNKDIAQRNQQIVEKLKAELSGVNEKLSRFDKETETNKYNYKGKGEAKSVVSTEITNFAQRRDKLVKDIALLQQDSKNNYQLTRNYKLEQTNMSDKNKAMHSKDKNIEQNLNNPMDTGSNSNAIQ